VIGAYRAILAFVNSFKQRTGNFRDLDRFFEVYVGEDFICLKCLADVTAHHHNGNSLLLRRSNHGLIAW